MKHLFLLLLLTGCATTNPVVVSVSPIASRVGLDAINKGGNAVDAAVATAFALAVTDPEAGNIGGGGFMLIAGPHQKPAFIDYRETAPSALKAEMLGGKRNEALLVGIPGTVRGLALAHAKFGRLPWKELVTPAIDLAEGFTIDQHVAAGLNKVWPCYPPNPELQRVFARVDQKPWKPGDTLRQPDLAWTLTQISADPQTFYTGRVAEQIAAEMRADGGLITTSDLAAYRPIWRTPIHGAFCGYDVYSSPPPSSGGIGLVEMLNVVECFNLPSFGRWDPRTIHILIETMRRAYCDRACYPGDPAFVPAPPAYLTEKSYAKKLAAGIDMTRATPSDELARSHGLQLTEPQDTTHFSIIDRDGLAVSNTYTLEELFGSKIVVRGAGFLLNDELNDFNSRPGYTTTSGDIGTRPNRVQGGKRPLSSMTPTILMRDNKVILVTGSPGGRTIINTVFQIVLNVIKFRMSPQQAIDAPRIHEQWLPDEVKIESKLVHEHPETIAALKAMGHHVTELRDNDMIGDAHTISLDPKTGRYVGAADRRRTRENEPSQ